MKDKALKTKEIILRASYELFSMHGYDNVPISLILEKTGLSKGGFYHHFKSKEDIIDAIAMLQVDASVQVVSAIVGEKGLSATEKLNKLLQQIQPNRDKNRDQLYNLFQPFINEGNIRLKERIEKYTLEKTIPLYTTLIRQGIKEGSFETCSPELAAETIIRTAPVIRLKMVLAYLSVEDKRKTEVQIKELADYLEEFVTRILGAKSGSLEIASQFKSSFLG